MYPIVISAAIGLSASAILIGIGVCIGLRQADKAFFRKQDLDWAKDQLQVQRERLDKACGVEESIAIRLYVAAHADVRAKR